MDSLIKAGVSPNERSRPWFNLHHTCTTILHLLCRHPSEPLGRIQTVIDHGAKINDMTSSSPSDFEESGPPLQQACWSGSSVITRSLIQRGADIDFAECIYGVRLQAAARAGHTGIVKLLLIEGADVNRHGGLFGTPVQAAAFEENIEILQCLLEHGADVNAGGGYFGCALSAALVSRHSEIVEFLLTDASGLDIKGMKKTLGPCSHAESEFQRKTTLRSFDSPVMWAVHFQDIALLTRLVSMGAHLDGSNRPWSDDRDHCLCHALAMKDESLCPKLLSLGVRVDTANYCPFQKAALLNDPSVFTRFLDAIHRDACDRKSVISAALETLPRCSETIVKMIIEIAVDGPSDLPNHLIDLWLEQCILQGNVPRAKFLLQLEPDCYRRKEKLLQIQSRPRPRGLRERISLGYQFENKQMDMFDFLLETGAT